MFDDGMDGVTQPVDLHRTQLRHLPCQHFSDSF